MKLRMMPISLIRNIGKIALPLTAGTIFFLANKANAQITFSGFGYPAANGVPTDSGLVKLINPSNDTITKKSDVLWKIFI